MSGNMEKAGILSLIKTSEDDVDVLVQYLTVSKKSEVFVFLKDMFGDQFLKFMDVFSSEVFKLPSRQETHRLIQNAKIYNYIESRGFSSGVVESCSKHFNRAIIDVEKIYLRIDKVLHPEKYVRKKGSKSNASKKVKNKKGSKSGTKSSKSVTS